MDGDEEQSIVFTILRIDARIKIEPLLDWVAVELALGDAEGESAVLDFSRGSWNGHSFYPPLYEDGHAALTVAEGVYRMGAYIVDQEVAQEEALTDIGSGPFDILPADPSDRPRVFAVPLTNTTYEHYEEGGPLSAAPAVAYVHVTPAESTSLPELRASLAALPPPIFFGSESGTDVEGKGVPSEATPSPAVVCPPPLIGLMAPPTEQPQQEIIPAADAIHLPLSATDPNFVAYIPAAFKGFLDALSTETTRAALCTAQDIAAVIHTLDLLRHAMDAYGDASFGVEPSIFYPHCARVVQRAWRRYAADHPMDAEAAAERIESRRRARRAALEAEEKARADAENEAIEAERQAFDEGYAELLAERGASLYADVYQPDELEILPYAAASIQSLWRGWKVRREFASAVQAARSAREKLNAEQVGSLHPSSHPVWWDTSHRYNVNPWGQNGLSSALATLKRVRGLTGSAALLACGPLCDAMGPPSSLLSLNSMMPFGRSVEKMADKLIDIATDTLKKKMLGDDVEGGFGRRVVGADDDLSVADDGVYFRYRGGEEGGALRSRGLPSAVGYHRGAHGDSRSPSPSPWGTDRSPQPSPSALQPPHAAFPERGGVSDDPFNQTFASAAEVHLAFNPTNSSPPAQRRMSEAPSDGAAELWVHSGCSSRFGPPNEDCEVCVPAPAAWRLAAASEDGARLVSDTVATAMTKWAASRLARRVEAAAVRDRVVALRRGCDPVASLSFSPLDGSAPPVGASGWGALTVASASTSSLATAAAAHGGWGGVGGGARRPSSPSDDASLVKLVQRREMAVPPPARPRVPHPLPSLPHEFMYDPQMGSVGEVKSALRKGGRSGTYPRPSRWSSMESAVGAASAGGAATLMSRAAVSEDTPPVVAGHRAGQGLMFEAPYGVAPPRMPGPFTTPAGGHGGFVG